MPFEIPTLPALVARAADDLARGGVDGVLRRSDSAVLARVMSGGVFGLYGLQAWLARQILPDTCEEESLGRWAQLKGVVRTPATRAVGAVDVTGTVDVIVPADFVWQTNDGVRLVVTADTVLTSGTVSVPVAAEDAGQAGNLAAGVLITAISPRAGVSDRAVVAAAGITGGTDVEQLERWRRRVLRSFRVQPHGGDAADYETWALEVAGITRAWARPQWLGPGTVGVFVVRDDDDVIVPDASELAAVKAHIDAVRPVTAEVYVMAPTLLVVPATIALTPDSDLLRAKVEAALQDLFMTEADLGGRLYRTHIAATISNVPGETDHVLAAPVADIVPAAGELPVLGAITWL
ncbi:baseplate J/gp47 family protein [Castellaniella sp. UC4442_H9]